MRLTRKISWEALAIGTVVLVGVVIRSWQIGASFHTDESFSVVLARDSFVQTIARSLADTPHPPLHNILLNVWMSLFGNSEPAVRALSVLFSCGFIIFVYKITRRYSDAWISLGVALLAALSPLFVYYGQQARPYSLIALMSAANLYAFLKALDAPTEKWPIRIWALTGIGLLYTQYLGVLFIGLEVIWAALEKKESRLRFVFFGAIIAGSLCPWVFAAMGAAVLRGATPVPQINWIGPPSRLTFLWFYVSIFGTRFATRWLFLTLSALVIAYTYSLYIKRIFPKEHRLLTLLAFGLPLIVYGISIWGPKSIFVYRQLEGAALATLLVTGLLAAELPKWTARAFLCILIGWSAASCRMALPDVVNPPWRETAQWIEQTYGSKLLIADDLYSQPGIEYYHKSGNVVLWPDMHRDQRRHSFLLACRPANCRTMLQELGARATLVKTWHWDYSQGIMPYNQLMLYEVRAQTDSVPRSTEAQFTDPRASAGKSLD